jgi:cytochrome c oxidase subunit 2
MKMWKKASAACLAGASLLVSQAASAVSDMPGGPAVRQLNLAEPVTKIAEQIHWLHWMMLIICTVIFVAVFGVMFYSIFKHRKSKGAKAATSTKASPWKWSGPSCRSSS